MNQLTEIEKAYIAGLLDGEGYIGIATMKSNEKSFSLNFKVLVNITNTNFLILSWLKEIIGLGTINQWNNKRKQDNKTQYKWRVCCDEAREFLNEIYPYLKIKKEITELVLSFPHKRGGKRNKEDYNKQIELLNEIKIKNKRGKSVIE